MAARIDGQADLETLVGLSEAVADTDGVALVSPPQPNDGLTSAVIFVNPTTAPQDEETDALLGILRSDVVPDALAGTDIEVRIGGITAVMVDFTDQVENRLPLFFFVCTS